MAVYTAEEITQVVSLLVRVKNARNEKLAYQLRVVEKKLHLGVHRVFHGTDSV